jgi:arylsulfatase A-like enzyme
MGLLGGPGCSSEDSEANSSSGRDAPLHVVLIVIDTLRADHLSCYGYWRETSPNIDGLAQRGVRFTRHISQSSWTAPSMVTMMTGQRVSGPRLDIPEDRPALAELFKDAGFRTAAWVANQLLTPTMGFARGFDRYTGEQAWHSTNPPGSLDAIVEWFEETRDQDTFTWVHFTDPHDPYVPPQDVRTGTPGRLSSEQERIIASAAEGRGLQGSVESQTEYIAREVGLYDDEIIAVDRKVRTLMLALRDNGGLENAIVVVTSDHGETLWERPESDGRVASQDKHRGGPAQIQHLLKQTHGDFVYQELVNVPLIIMAPGLGRGEVVDTVAEAVHLPSTLLELAGVEVEGVETMVGVDLFGRESIDGAYTMTKLGEAFISRDGWKLILPTDLGKGQFAQQLQLFDLNRDPGELLNLADEQPEKVEELKQELHERRATAMPTPSLEEQGRKIREQTDALKSLGYIGGGHLDEMDEH